MTQQKTIAQDLVLSVIGPSALDVRCGVLRMRQDVHGEGKWVMKAMVIDDLGGADRLLRRWYQSDDYQALLRIRQRAARSNIVAVQGV